MILLLMGELAQLVRAPRLHRGGSGVRVPYSPPLVNYSHCVSFFIVQITLTNIDANKNRFNKFLLML